MTPAEEDALIYKTLEEISKDGEMDDAIRLAIRAAVAAERERCIEAVMRATPDRKNLALVGDAAHYIAAAAAIRKGE